VRENRTHGSKRRREETSASRPSRAARAPPADPTSKARPFGAKGRAGRANDSSGHSIVWTARQSRAELAPDLKGPPLVSFAARDGGPGTAR
jgi:hypothetical protein